MSEKSENGSFQKLSLEENVIKYNQTVVCAGNYFRSKIKYKY